jgi:hypothetical protein
MPYNRIRGAQIPVDPAKVVQDLVYFFLPYFMKASWRERLNLLENIDAQISHDFVKEELCRRISQNFTFEIIKRLAIDVVTCKEQAFILLNSSNVRHHEAARAWFVINQVPCAILEESPLSSPAGGQEHRHARRHSVQLSGLIAANDVVSPGQVVDISATGAKVTIAAPPPTGTHVVLDIPLLGRVAALVVWVTASMAGVSFLIDQANQATC